MYIPTGPDTLSIPKSPVNKLFITIINDLYIEINLSFANINAGIKPFLTSILTPIP